jgi:ribosomal protein L9
MEVILLERVAKLGQMGDVVKVKDGYARNFLLPRHKALRATEANKSKFAEQRAQLEANNLARKKDADAVAAKLDGQSFTLIRQAGESGVLYGSVSARDLSDVITAGGFTVSRGQIALEQGRGGSPPGSLGQRDGEHRPLAGRSRAPGARRECAGARGRQPRRSRPRNRRGAGRSGPERRDVRPRGRGKVSSPYGAKYFLPVRICGNHGESTSRKRGVFFIAEVSGLAVGRGWFCRSHLLPHLQCLRPSETWLSSPALPRMS